MTSLGRSIRFSRDDEPSAWDAADLVVVDEAHNLARLSVSTDPVLAFRFERLREIALASPRLLMLSATPALHNEDAFLAMLKLLDPAVYAEPPGQFRARLRRSRGPRPRLARPATGPPRHPAEGAPDARSKPSFPDDAEVGDLIARARERSVARQDKDQTASLIQALRTHVAEVVPVHRRMLRTRRTTALEGTYRVSGRRAPEPVLLESTLPTKLQRLSTDGGNRLWRRQKATRQR